MKQPYRPLTEEWMRTRTSHARTAVDTVLMKARLIEADSRKTERVEACQCKACFYAHPDRIGGQALTESACGLCGKPLHFSSTCVDALCPECAKAHSLCTHCGGDLEMRTGRRKWPTAVIMPEREVTWLPRPHHGITYGWVAVRGNTLAHVYPVEETDPATRWKLTVYRGSTRGSIPDLRSPSWSTGATCYQDLNYFPDEQAAKSAGENSLDEFEGGS